MATLWSRSEFAGSQAAIRSLPHLLRQGTVGIAPLTYGEYAPAFARAGHRVTTLDVTRSTLPDDITHAVVVNPNNPTADHLRPATLLQWHETLSERGGTLIVDEAFADAMPSGSLAEPIRFITPEVPTTVLKMTLPATGASLTGVIVMTASALFETLPATVTV